MTTLQHITCAALLAVAALPVTAQTNGSNSPYSRYGFGLLGDGGNAFNKGMAGTAYAMRNGKELNTKNPASYAALDSLSFIFDFGVSLQNGNIAQGGTKTNARNTSADYVTAGFRIAPHIGMAVGLLPYSTIGYETSTQSTLTTASGTVTQTRNYSGDGGLHEVYGGFGWEPFKNLSVGLNAGYLWGDLTHTALSSFDNSNISSTRQVYTADIRTYKLDFGVQFEHRLNKKHLLTFGLAYGLGHDVNRKASYYNQKVVSNSVSQADTLSCANAFQLPHTVGVGVTWAYAKSLRVGVDYTFSKWGSVKMPVLTQSTANGGYEYSARTGSLTDQHKVSVGAEYIADPDGVRWRQRVRYRAGFSFSTPYVNIDGNKGPQNYLASVGVALPIMNMHNNRSLLNISAQYERVKPRVGGMITENYIRLSIGLTFNERWFMKWKAE